jgi:FlaA1/EpsC-like NDP-sugar epimerase
MKHFIPNLSPALLSARLIGFSRPLKQSLMLITDAILLMFSVWLAYSLRLSMLYIPNPQQWLLIMAAPLCAIPVFIRMGLYRSVIRYLGEQALWSIFKGISLAVLLWAALVFMTQMSGIHGVPRTVPLLYWFNSMVLICSVRFTARWLLWLPVRSHFSGKQVLIYGAGEAGRQLAASLRHGNTLFPAGFLEDDVTLHGKDIDGLRVYSPEHLPLLIQRFDIHDIIVTLPFSSSQRKKEIIHFLEQFHLHIRILPALADIASGRHLVNMVREIDIGDLLGRDPVSADPALLRSCISNQVVMVTGAGGSIGSELALQIASLQPKLLIVMDNSEYALYQIHRTLSTQTQCTIVPCLGSVLNVAQLNELFQKFRVQTIYHAAAYKHVPLVETNALEGAINNVLGTWHLAMTAFDAQVAHVVLISTDKAVRPTNIMGATKRYAEMIIQYFAARATQEQRAQQFCAVRFGNVLGSSGSVIPLFKEQIAQGGPLTITHADITRYFMSIHEAVELVIQAGSLSEGGEIFLLDMGEPVKIMDLARNMVRLAGHTVQDELHPEGDITITVTGLRPGEKLYEELLIANHHASSTPHPKIMKAHEPYLAADAFIEMTRELQQAMIERDESAVRSLLMHVANTTLTEAPPH